MDEIQEKKNDEQAYGQNEHSHQSTSTKKAKANLDFVFDVPLEVHVQLGRIPISLRKLLGLRKGSVLELDKLAGEPLEILIDEKLICRGEVIVVNEKYGIRMTDIIKPTHEADLLAHPE